MKYKRSRGHFTEDLTSDVIRLVRRRPPALYRVREDQQVRVVLLSGQWGGIAILESFGGGAGDADSCGDFSRLIRPPAYHQGRKAEDHRAERCYLCPPWDPHGPERMDPNYGCFTKDDPRYGKGGFD